MLLKPYVHATGHKLRKYYNIYFPAVTFYCSYCRGSYGKPVDIWAIGCILGELADGQVRVNALKSITLILAMFVV